MQASARSELAEELGAQLWFNPRRRSCCAAVNRLLNQCMSCGESWLYSPYLVRRIRQRTIINRLLDGFEGKLTSSKWAKLTKCSQDTALRDIHDLLARQILAKDKPGGRSTSYRLPVPQPPTGDSATVAVEQELKTDET